LKRLLIRQEVVRLRRLRSCHRQFSILSSIKEKVATKIDEKKTEKQKDQFKNQMQDLLNIKMFTLNEHYKLLQEYGRKAGVSGWRSKLPGAAKQQEIENAKQEITVLEKFTEAEREDPALIDREARLRVAADAGKEVPYVNGVLRNYEQMKSTHEWIHSRRAKQKPIPDNQEDMMDMLATDPIKLKWRRGRRRN